MATRRGTAGVVVRTILGLLLGAATTSAEPHQRVRFLADSVVEIHDRVMRLLGGSVWLLDRRPSPLTAADIVIVFRDPLVGGKPAMIATAFLDGEEVLVRHLQGTYVTASGFLSTVVEAMGDGAVLRLADGELLSVPYYHRFNTARLPPYRALVTSSRQHLFNLKHGKWVWVSPVR